MATDGSACACPGTAVHAWCPANCDGPDGLGLGTGCVTNNQQCENDASCADGFRLNAGACEACTDANCVTCTGVAGTCEACVAGYGVNAGACVQCLAGTYQDAIGNLLEEDTCRVCPVGYETRIAACSAGGTGLKVGLPCLSDADCDGAACDSAAASVEATACAPKRPTHTRRARPRAARYRIVIT